MTDETPSQHLKRHLIERAEMFAHAFQNCPLMDEFLSEKGVIYEPASDQRLKKGPKKECFGNAAQAVLSDCSLRYAEGYAISGSLGIFLPMHHAWVLDEEGRVLDPTWDDPELSGYVGVEFDTVTLRDLLLRNEVYGLLEVGGFEHEMVLDVFGWRSKQKLAQRLYE